MATHNNITLNCECPLGKLWKVIECSALNLETKLARFQAGQGDVDVVFSCFRYQTHVFHTIFGNVFLCSRVDQSGLYSCNSAANTSYMHLVCQSSLFDHTVTIQCDKNWCLDD